MLSLIIIYPIKTGSLADGYGSVSGRARHVIVIKRHSVIGKVIVLVSSFPSLLGDFHIRVTIFA
jgi:hypothetical protein